MSVSTLLRPTAHVEIHLHSRSVDEMITQEIREDVIHHLRQNYECVRVGQKINHMGDLRHQQHIKTVVIADYTGPKLDFHLLDDIELDVQTYTLKAENEAETRRRINQGDDDEGQQARVLSLPNVLLNDEWDSLIYDEALPSQLLRYLTRMLGVMKQPGLNLSTFNWNRLCLLHGPPGSGKSTLCRALAQKLSIRLSRSFPNAVLVEVNTNAMLSKYFGESGKLIAALFARIHALSQSSKTLVCVVMDEVETIAGSREKSSRGGECADGLRATNQLLTALDRIRVMPNIIVLCTSNLIDAIDPAFLDRVDIKQFIPSPSPAAIYNIFRSCLNELVRANLIDDNGAASAPITEETEPPNVPTDTLTSSSPLTSLGSSSPVPESHTPPPPSMFRSSESSAVDQPIPTFAAMSVLHAGDPTSAARRVWALAQACEGFSGRALRRLPILGLAMYTWGGTCSLDDAVEALGKAVEQEGKVKLGEGSVSK